MTITIYEGYSDDYIILKSNHEEWKKRWGTQVNVYTNGGIYSVLQDIANYVNKELGEECLFEID